MKNTLYLCMVSFLILVQSVAAQDALAQYEIGGKVYSLQGYFISALPENRHFLAVFVETDEQSLNPESFDFAAACVAVLARPPVHKNIPKTETVFQHGVVFIKTVSRRFFGLVNTSVSSFTEFDVDEGVCVKTKSPGKIYDPPPGFVP